MINCYASALRETATKCTGLVGLGRWLSLMNSADYVSTAQGFRGAVMRAFGWAYTDAALDPLVSWAEKRKV